MNKISNIARGLYRNISVETLMKFKLSWWCRLGIHTWGPWVDRVEGGDYDVRVCMQCNRGNVRAK